MTIIPNMWVESFKWDSTFTFDPVEIILSAHVDYYIVYLFNKISLNRPTMESTLDSPLREVVRLGS